MVSKLPQVITLRISVQEVLGSNLFRDTYYSKGFLFLRYRLGVRGIGDRFLAGARDFFFFRTPKPALGPTQSPIQWPLGIKQLEREAEHSLQSTVEVKYVWWSYTSTPQYVFM
jgi:hypothetical protein